MTSSFNTPLLFLIFNRPDITQRVFNQIKAIKPMYLYVAADGPRPGRQDDIIACLQTRQIINQIDWPCELKTLFRDENLGCGNAVCSAISWFFEQVEQGIILEDDCFPDLSFFPYCSNLLEKYKNDEDIYVISGTNLQNGKKCGDASYYFSNYSITWGWATWRRAWEHFNYEIKDIKKSFRMGELDHVFQRKAEKLFWMRNFKKVELNNKNIWDYQWFYCIWKNKGIGIAPNTNLIINIGFENSGTHTFLRDSRREPQTITPMKFPVSHASKMIDRKADLYLYNNVFSHSPSRLYRLVRENGILAIFRYILLRIF